MLGPVHWHRGSQMILSHHQRRRWNCLLVAEEQLARASLKPRERSERILQPFIVCVFASKKGNLCLYQTWIMVILWRVAAFTGVSVIFGGLFGRWRYSVRWPSLISLIMNHFMDCQSSVLWPMSSWYSHASDYLRRSGLIFISRGGFQKAWPLEVWLNWEMMVISGGSSSFEIW